MKPIRLFLAIFVFAQAAHADTIKSGGNIFNETWTLAGSPYIVQGDVTVVAGSTLTIEPGVEVRCAAGDAQGAGLDLVRVELTVKGTLMANGTVAQPITFRAANSTPGAWYGIVVDAIASSASIVNADIRHAIYGVRSHAQGAVLNVSSNALSQNQFGIAWFAGTPTFDSLRVFRNGTGVWPQGSGAGILQNCLIYNNTNYGVLFEPTASVTMNLKSSTLDRNGNYGVAVAGTGLGTLNVEDCIIANQNFGFYHLGPAQVNVSYCDVYNPAGTNFVNVTTGAGVISGDPLFLDRDGLDNSLGTADDNFQLQSGSPCIDAGSGPQGFDDPTVPNTGKAGSFNDIGYEELVPLLRILTVEVVNNDVRVSSYPTFSNKTYQLFVSTNLSTNPASWVPVSSATQGSTGLILQQTDPGVSLEPQRFYRVRENN